MARLARLELSEEERAALGEELKAVLGYVAVLERVDTEGVPPTSHPIPLVTPFREDGAVAPMSREQALANAPESDGEAFVVPRVV